RGCGGFWLMSTPAGDVIGSTTGLLASVAFLAFLLTIDLHLLRLPSRPKDQLGTFEQTVKHVGLLSHAIIRHLPFAVFTHYQQDGNFTMLYLGWHLDISLCTVVVDSQGA